MKKRQSGFVICINNRDYPTSLELRKIYRIVPDDPAAAHKQIRISDESGEDYLYPAECFVSIRLPQAVEKAVLQDLVRNSYAADEHG